MKKINISFLVSRVTKEGIHPPPLLLPKPSSSAVSFSPSLCFTSHSQRPACMANCISPSRRQQAFLLVPSTFRAGNLMLHLHSIFTLLFSVPYPSVTLRQFLFSFHCILPHFPKPLLSLLISSTMMTGSRLSYSRCRIFLKSWNLILEQPGDKNKVNAAWLEIRKQERVQQKKITKSIYKKRKKMTTKNISKK